MKKERMQQVHEHFNGEANIFDSNILKSVPYYSEMVGTIIDMLPFSKNQSIRIADIGTGTGNIALAVMTAFPSTKLHCIDLAPNMLENAKLKLNKFNNVKYILANVADYNFAEKYDAIISSLTLHHLETDKDKNAFHNKAYKALKPGGMFINADIIIAPNHKTQNVYINKWKDFVIRASSEVFFKDRYKKYLAEDRPAILLNEINSLKNTGFKDVEVFWKYYNFAVYGGRK